MDNKINIRKAVEKDLKAMDEIYLEGVVDELKTQFPKRSKLSIIREMNQYKKQRVVDFKKDIKSKNEYWVVAEKENKILGFGSAEIKGKEGKLILLYIKKDFRRKGLGRKLTNERIKWLKKKGVKTISAGMLINNKASRNNLESIGFKPTSIRLELKIK